MRLKDIYAVCVGERNGEPTFVPRSKSKAEPTLDAPKLWVMRHDAERAARFAKGRVVTFMLVKVNDKKEEKNDGQG